MKAKLLITLVCLISIASAARWNLTVTCQKCSTSNKCSGFTNCYKLTRQGVVSALTFNEQVCGQVQCKLETNYTIQVDTCTHDGLGVQCGTQVGGVSSGVCVYPNVQNSCARSIGINSLDKCLVSNQVSISCAACNKIPCSSQCISRTNQNQTCSTYSSCSSFQNKTVTVSKCVGDVDYTKNTCTCCMTPSPANRLGVCASRTAMYNSSTFQAYATARSALTESSVMMTLLVLLGVLTLLF